MPDPSPPGSRQTRDRHLLGACASGATDPRRPVSLLQVLHVLSCKRAATTSRREDTQIGPLVLALGRRIIRHPICKAGRPGPCSAWPPRTGSTLSTRCLGRTSPHLDIGLLYLAAFFVSSALISRLPGGRRVPLSRPSVETLFGPNLDDALFPLASLLSVTSQSCAACPLPSLT